MIKPIIPKVSNNCRRFAPKCCADKREDRFKKFRRENKAYVRQFMGR